MPTITLHPSRVASEDSYYKSADSSHPLTAILGKGTSNGTYAQWYMIDGGSAYTRVMYGFDVSSIPANATINKVTCSAKCQAQNASAARGGNTRTHLWSGSTEIAASETRAFGTSATVVTISGSMTREQLDGVKMDVFASRGLLSTSTSYYIRCYGIDLTVEYEVPADPGGGSGDHQAVIGGTAYSVTDGRCMISGTGYDIKEGRTLVGGTGYDVTFSSEASLAWHLNDTVSLPPKTLRANFSTVSMFGGTDTWTGIMPGEDDSGLDALCYMFGTNDSQVVYHASGGDWVVNLYQDITFTEPPEGELLAWLEANGTPQ